LECLRRQRLERPNGDLFWSDRGAATARLNPLVDAMRDFFAEENPTKRDAIAAHQFSVLRDYQGPRDKKLRLEDVKQMFAEMKDIVG